MTPETATTAATRCSLSCELQVANGSAPVAVQPPPTTLEVHKPPPAACDTAASHAVRRGLPRITATNATSYPPPSLNSYRTTSARAPADSAPALWYWQMTGDEWLRDGHSYDLEKKRHARMVWRRTRTRDASGHFLPASDCVLVYLPTA